MNGFTKTTTTALLACTSLLAGQAAQAELSGNVAASSDYLWRGITQTAHSAAVSGGVDYGHASGLYAGTWVSNITLDTEIDLYAGFAGEVSGLSYDVGYIYYHYPHVLEDFGEVYASAGYSLFSVYYAYDTENKNGYVAGSVGYDIAEGLSIGANVGSYMFDDSSSDYVHYDVGVTKAFDGWEGSLMVSDTDLDAGPDEKPTLVVSFSKSFDI